MKTSPLECLENTQEFQIRLEKANWNILELLPWFTNSFYKDYLPLVGLAENDVSTLEALSSERKTRICQCGLPVFSLNFLDIGFRRGLANRKLVENANQLMQAITSRMPNVDPSVFLSLPRKLRQKIKDANNLIIDVVDAFSNTGHPLSLALFGIPVDELPEMVNQTSHLRYLAAEGIPFFKVNPVWTMIDFRKKEAFTELRGKAIGIYLSKINSDTIPKNRKRLMLKADDKKILAKRFINVGARAVFLSHFMQIPPDVARNMYRKETGKSPVSGQTPKDHLWFKATSERRRIGAMLMITYARWLQYLPTIMSDSRQMAVYLTYWTYIQGEPEASVDIERFELLTRGWSTASSILQGEQSNFTNEEELSNLGHPGLERFRVKCCRRCRVPYLIDLPGETFLCNDCQRRRT